MRTGGIGMPGLSSIASTDWTVSPSGASERMPIFTGNLPSTRTRVRFQLVSSAGVETESAYCPSSFSPMVNCSLMSSVRLNTNSPSRTAPPCSSRTFMATRAVPPIAATGNDAHSKTMRQRCRKPFISR